MGAAEKEMENWSDEYGIIFAVVATGWLASTWL
jgi:hypothetical protein